MIKTRRKLINFEHKIAKSSVSFDPLLFLLFKALYLPVRKFRLDVFGSFLAAPHHVEKFFHGKFAHLIKVLADGGYGWICTLHPNRVVIAYELDFFADTSNTQIPDINTYSYKGLAYRHSEDVSFTKSETTQLKYNGNAVNMNYMDGHAETVSRDSLNAITNNTLIFREGIDYMDRKPVK